MVKSNERQTPTLTAAAQQSPSAALISRSLMMAAITVFALCFAISSAHSAGSYDPPKATASKTHKSYDKAVADLAKDDFQSALTALDIVIKDEPKNADAWNLKGFSHRKLGQYEASESAYKTALRLNPKHSRAMEYMGELYLTLGDLPKAEALLERLNKACSFNCKDRDMLKKAIIAYKAANG